MGVQSDNWIRRMALEREMIRPFEEKQIQKGISFGISSYGYDFRLDRTFKVYRPRDHDIIDPKNFKTLDFETCEGEVCIIPPNSYVLGQSLEYFKIPRNILVLSFGKSTYARCGVLVNGTPLEPEWEGYITVSISNTTPSPVKLYAGEGLGQLVFLEASEVCETSYADKKGKYQGQTEITGAKVKR